MIAAVQPDPDKLDLKFGHSLVALACQRGVIMIARGNQSPESEVKEIRRNTRRKYTSEEKIHMCSGELVKHLREVRYWPSVSLPPATLSC